MHQPEVFELSAPNGYAGVLPRTNDQLHVQREDRQDTASKARKRTRINAIVGMAEGRPRLIPQNAKEAQETTKGEARPLSSALSAIHWPALFGQRLRDGYWIPAQIALTGGMDCPTPDPDYSLNVGGWQISYKRLQTAKKQLSTHEQRQLEHYLQADAELESYRNEAGELCFRLRPVPIDSEVLLVLGKLWEMTK